MKPLNTIEGFCGTKSFSKVAKKKGHKTFTIDNNPQHNPDQCVDFLQLPIINFINEHWDMAWFSVPCTGFSVASIGKHWGGGYRKYIPISNTSKIGLKLLERTIEWIAKVKPDEWYIENPRGVMRKVIDNIFKKYGLSSYRRITVTYCQYGDSRMKPTDIWTNNKDWKPRPMCKNGDKCHTPAPRGAKTGTQGLKGAIERSIIPESLFDEIFEHKIMKILYLTPHNPFIKTPETGFAEQLAKLGHHVTFASEYSPDLLKNEYDIVYGAMEYSMNLANFIGEKLNIPVYNHMEWVPPWRTGAELPENWGYDGTTAEKMTPELIEYWTEIYKQQVVDWEKATIRSCAGKAVIKYIEPFTSKPIEPEIKYCAPDFEKLEKYRDNSIKEKYQIMSTARLVPHKRVVHVIRALAKIDNPPLYKIVGYGNELEPIKTEAKRLGVKIEFVGSGQNGIKERIIQESLFSVNLWAGIPVGESAYFGKPAICYDEPLIKEIFESTTNYAVRNSIKSLAREMTFMINDPIYRKNRGESVRRALLDGKINGMKRPEDLAKDVERILKKGVKLWKEKS